MTTWHVRSYDTVPRNTWKAKRELAFVSIPNQRWVDERLDVQMYTIANTECGLLRTSSVC